MIDFQLLGLAFLSLLLVLILKGAAQGRSPRRVVAFWSSLTLAGILMLAFPRVTIVAANFLGIGRGADLVFYCAILAGLAAFYYLYLLYRRLHKALTDLAREHTIATATQDAKIHELRMKVSGKAVS